MTKATRNETIQIRLTATQKQIIQWASDELGFTSLSKFVLTTLMKRALSVVDLGAKKKELLKLAADSAGLTPEEYAHQAVLDKAMQDLAGTTDE